MSMPRSYSFSKVLFYIDTTSLKNGVVQRLLVQRSLVCRAQIVHRVSALANVRLAQIGFAVYRF